MKNREQTDYNKIVNFDNESKEISVLDYTFKYPDGMKGATGTKFEPVSKKYYKECMRIDAIAEHLEVCYSLEELYENHYTESYKVLAKRIKDAGEVEEYMFDCSYRELWHELRKELNLSMNEAFIFNCTGGGRMFDKEFEGNINPELSAIIREFEN